MEEDGSLNTSILNQNQKYIDAEYYNDDLEEVNLFVLYVQSKHVEKVCAVLNPYFSPNCVPSSIYLKKNILPIVYEALIELEKIRPADPVEFFAAYILDKNKKSNKIE